MLKEEVDINIILCPKCKKTPLLFLIPNKPGYITIKCSCKYNGNYLLSQYLSIINNYRTYFHNIEDNTFTINDYYCITCKELYNKENIAIHQNHSFIHLNKISKFIQIEKIMNKLNKTKELFECANKKHLSRFLRIDEVKGIYLNQIDIAYKINCKNLNNTYKLILILIDNYKKNPNNVYCALNVYNNSYFKCPQYLFKYKEDYFPKIADLIYKIYEVKNVFITSSIIKEKKKQIKFFFLYLCVYNSIF